MTRRRAHIEKGATSSRPATPQEDRQTGIVLGPWHTFLRNRGERILYETKHNSNVSHNTYINPLCLMSERDTAECARGTHKSHLWLSNRINASDRRHKQDGQITNSTAVILFLQLKKIVNRKFVGVFIMTELAEMLSKTGDFRFTARIEAFRKYGANVEQIYFRCSVHCMQICSYRQRFQRQRAD